MKLAILIVLLVCASAYAANTPKPPKPPKPPLSKPPKPPPKPPKPPIPKPPKPPLSHKPPPKPPLTTPKPPTMPQPPPKSFPLSYATGERPFSIQSADFNNDGKVDLVTANMNSNTVSVLLGNGDGTFGIAANYSTNAGSYPEPYSVTTADFNRDGFIDIAVANVNGPGSVSILSGIGDGTFASAANYPVGDNPFSVTSGDFDGDGYIDIAVADANQRLLRTLINKKDGTFGPVVNYYCAGPYNGPISVTAADFNGDTHVDLATADFDSSTVSFLMGNGDGTFASMCVNYGTGVGGLYSVTAADFNNDGNIDLAAAAPYPNTANIFLNSGTGDFSATTNYTTGTNPYSVTSGDFNSDGNIDIATGDSGANTVSILLGKGDGTFFSANDFTTGDGPYSVTAADFNGDGHVDIATANSDANTVSILLGNGDGTFA